MGYDYNEVILCGRITSPPDYVTTQKGVMGVKFYFGVDRITGEGKRVTDVFHVAAFGDVADTIHNLCRKTTEMLIRGHLRPLPYGGGADVQADFVKVDYVPQTNGNAYAAPAAEQQEQMKINIAED